MAETWPKKPLNFITTLDRHEGLFLMSTPPIPPICPGFAWHIGFGLEIMSRIGTDKWNDTVLVDGVPCCSRGNAPEHCMVPHYNLFPAPGIPSNPNLFIPLLILLSSSKNFMAVGSVIATNGPVAVSIPGVKVIGINLACNDPVPLPTDVVIHTGSTVILGFTWGDLVAALLTWAFDVVIAIAMKLLGKFLKGIGKKLAGKLAGPLLKSENSLMQKLGQKLSNFSLGKKGPPGFLKRQTLNMLDRLGIPKVFNQPSRVAGETALDRLLSSTSPKAGQFQSVADRLVSREQSVIKQARKKLFGEAKEAVFGNKTYSESLPERLGRYVDGRAEPVPSGAP